MDFARPVDLGWIVFNGVSNAVGQYWWTRALHLAPASAVAPFFYLSLVWASILGFAIWGEVPTISLLVGSAVVIDQACFYSGAKQMRARRWRRQAPSEYPIRRSDDTVVPFSVVALFATRSKIREPRIELRLFAT